MSKQADFVAMFAKIVLTLDVQDVFALTATKFHSGVLTEFEM